MQSHPEPDPQSDTKHPISSAWASQAQPGTQIAKSIDSQTDTIYHSRWGGQTKFPVILQYTFVGVLKIDYVEIIPRLDRGVNGFFGVFQIWVDRKGKPWEMYGEFDFGMKGKVEIVRFQPAVVEPFCVQFRVKSGYGGYVSVSEIGFYQYGSNNSPPPKDLIQIPMGGNTFTTSGPQPYINDTGIDNWSSPSTMLGTIFQITRPGRLEIYLKAQLASPSVVDVHVNGGVERVGLERKNVQFLGCVQECEPGYMEVALQGVQRSGKEFARPTAIMVRGEASKNMNYVHNFSFYFGRRGPSAHLRYTVPSNVTIEWFYSEITVPEGQDAVGSYFMANGFQSGYFGFKINSETERDIIFAVWSPFQTDDPKAIPQDCQVQVLERGKDVQNMDFGNQGSGKRGILIYPWKAETTYKFLTRVRPVKNNCSQYTAYFYSPQWNEFRLISKLLRPKTQTYYTGPHSFIENFLNNRGHIHRKAFYSNQWIYTTDRKWIELTEAYMSCDATGNAKMRMDFGGGVDGDGRGFFLENCGFFDGGDGLGEALVRKAKGVVPKVAAYMKD